MPELIVGAHVSIAKGFVAAAKFAVIELKSNALQLFLKSPRGGGQCKLTDSEAKDYKKYVQINGLKFTVAHGSYLLNFAKDLSKNKWPLVNLIDDLFNIERLGGAGVILHIGKALELPRSEALSWVIKNIDYTIKKTEKLKARIILENTAGQGTELGVNLEELSAVYRGLKKSKRVQFCLDTCHAFASGCDLRTSMSVKKFFTEFDKKLGLKNLACIHFNDSKSDFASRVDRHENLGRGKIGRVGLIAVAKFASAKGIPLILETPERDGGSHLEDLEILKKWLGII